MSMPPLGARYKFDFGDDGIFSADCTVVPAVLSNEDSEADTTFICSVSTFQAMLTGSQDPTMAYMMGKLKIQGSMGYAMKLNAILGD